MRMQMKVKVKVKMKMIWLPVAVLHAAVFFSSVFTL